MYDRCIYQGVDHEADAALVGADHGGRLQHVPLGAVSHVPSSRNAGNIDGRHLMADRPPRR